MTDGVSLRALRRLGEAIHAPIERQPDPSGWRVLTYDEQHGWQVESGPMSELEADRRCAALHQAGEPSAWAVDAHTHDAMRSPGRPRSELFGVHEMNQNFVQRSSLP